MLEEAMLEEAKKARRQEGVVNRRTAPITRRRPPRRPREAKVASATSPRRSRFIETELVHGAGVEDDLVVAERNSSAERVAVLPLVLGEVLAQVGRRLALGLPVVDYI